MEIIVTIISLIISSGTLTAIVKAIVDNRKQKEAINKAISQIDEAQNTQINSIFSEMISQTEKINEIKEITKSLLFVSELESCLYSIQTKIISYNTIEDEKKRRIILFIQQYISIAKTIISTNWHIKNVLEQLNLFTSRKIEFECEKYLSELTDIVKLENGSRRKKFLNLSENFIWLIIEKI